MPSSDSLLVTTGSGGCQIVVDGSAAWPPLLLPKTSSMLVEADACEADVARDGGRWVLVRQGNAAAL
jgi:hypothetical protein